MPRKPSLVDVTKQLARFGENITTISFTLPEQTDIVDLKALQSHFNLHRTGSFSYKLKVVEKTVVVTKVSHPVRGIIGNFIENTVGENNFRMDVPHTATSYIPIPLPHGTSIQADLALCNHFFRLQKVINRSLMLVLVELDDDFDFLTEKIGKIFTNDAISTIWVFYCITDESTERIQEMYLLEFTYKSDRSVSNPPSANTRSQNNRPIKDRFQTTQFVSCGPTAQEETIAAILLHTAVDPNCFVGIGSPTDQKSRVVRLREPRPVSQAELDMIVELSQDDLWRNVPSAEFPGLIREGIEFNLNHLCRDLQKASCWSEDD